MNDAEKIFRRIVKLFLHKVPIGFSFENGSFRFTLKDYYLLQRPYNCDFNRLTADKSHEWKSAYELLFGRFTIFDFMRRTAEDMNNDPSVVLNPELVRLCELVYRCTSWSAEEFELKLAAEGIDL